jgi:hypothetical protein
LQLLHCHVFVILPKANTPQTVPDTILLPAPILDTLFELQVGHDIFLPLFGCPQLGHASASADICLLQAIHIIKAIFITPINKITIVKDFYNSFKIPLII